MHLTLLLASALAFPQPQTTQTTPVPAVTPGQTLPAPTVPGITPPSGMPTNVPNTNLIDDKKFLKETCSEEMLQIEISKLAARTASTPAVRQLAGNLLDDLAKAADQLRQLAIQKNVELPTELDSKQQGRIAKLAKLSGAKFEKIYLRDQLTDQETGVKRFTAEKGRGQDPDVMAFAAAALPALEKNLQASKAVRDSWKKE